MSKTTDATTTTSGDVVDFWFDPVCPWAWMTSRWMEEVERVRAVTVRWHIMSLAVLNEGAEVSAENRELAERVWWPARLVNAAREQHGQDVVKRLYDALGTRFHPGGRDIGDRSVYTEVLAEVGLPAELADAVTSDALDDSLRASHEEGISIVGQDVGTPVVAVNGVGFFGPVVTPAPRGEAAGQLWDGCLLVAGTPGFYELKRSRDQGPIFA